VQMLKVYAFENDWAKGPEALHDWARGKRSSKRKVEGAAAGNMSKMRMGRSDFWYGKPNKNCMGADWAVDASCPNPIYQQQYVNTQTSATQFALPIEGCRWFNKAQLVTYLFLLGKRVLIYDDANDGIPRYEEAHQLLRTAFRVCSGAAHRNKHQILTYLAPAAMLCGVLPSEALLTKYGMAPCYWAVAEAVRNGDIWLFERTLSDPANKDFMLRKGIWMLMSALRLVVQRGFFHHVHRLMQLPKVNCHFSI
jgi:hypothetical protein